MNILDIVPKKAVFRQTGTPVEPELRPVWRISLIALILSLLSSGNKANAKKIQVLCSLISSSDKRQQYFLPAKDLLDNFNVRFDPLVDRAIDLGIGEKVFELDSSKSIKLTKKGLKFAKKIEFDKDVFINEKGFILKFKKSFFTDEVIDRLIAGVRL